MKSSLKIATGITRIVSLYKAEDSSIDSTARDIIAGAYASFIVGYELPLPSGPVDNSRQWYLDNCSPVVDEHMRNINEVVIIDFVPAIRRCQAIWELRYNMLHNAANPSTIAAVMAGLTDVSVNDYLAPEFSAILERMNSIAEVRDITYALNSTVK